MSGTHLACRPRKHSHKDHRNPLLGQNALFIELLAECAAAAQGTAAAVLDRPHSLSLLALPLLAETGSRSLEKTVPAFNSGVLLLFASSACNSRQLGAAALLALTCKALGDINQPAVVSQMYY
jgi:hypothetical protein